MQNISSRCCRIWTHIRESFATKLLAGSGRDGSSTMLAMGLRNLVLSIETIEGRFFFFENFSCLLIELLRPLMKEIPFQCKFIFFFFNLSILSLHKLDLMLTICQIPFSLFLGGIYLPYILSPLKFLTKPNLVQFKMYIYTFISPPA